MPVEIHDLINVVAEVCENRHLKASVKGSLKGGLLSGSSAALGGLVLGPVGLAIGGIIGGTLAAISAKNSFKPVAQIIQEMTIKQKQKLYDTLVHAFRNFGVQDITTVAALILANMDLQELLIREVTKYLQSEMSLRVQQ